MLSVKGIPRILGVCNEILHGDTTFRGYNISVEPMIPRPSFSYCKCN